MTREENRFWKRCANEEELYQWVKEHCDMLVPRRAVCAGHNAPFEYLKAAYFGCDKDLVVWAPRGGGKTRLGAVATLLDLAHKRGISVRILAGSMDQGRRMWDHLSAELEKLAEDGESRMKLRDRSVRLENGSSGAVIAASQRAVRGIRVQKLRCDEVDEIDRRIWEAAQLVTRSLRVKHDDGSEELVRGTVEAISTVHRPWGLMTELVDGAQASGKRVIKWCLMEVLERCPDWRQCETCPLHPECGGRAKNDCDGFFSINDAIALKRRVSKESWETEMMCLRPVVRGRVYPSFDETLHVREKVDGASPDLWLGIDFGFANPFVCLWIRSFADGRVHVIDEYVQDSRTVAEHVVEIQSRQRHGPVRIIGCDPAGAAANEQTAKSNVTVLRHAGFTVKTRGSRIAEGIELVRAALMNGAGEARLFIHPNCVQLIKAMKAYRYEEGKGEVPVKDGHDHLVDALRYFFVNSSKLGEAKGGGRY